MSAPARYPWPASQLSEADLFLLWRAREMASTKTTITALVAAAVRTVYGHLATADRDTNANANERMAA